MEGAEEAEEAEETEEVEEKGEEKARTEGERERWRGCFISFSLPPSLPELYFLLSLCS